MALSQKLKAVFVERTTKWMIRWLDSLERRASETPGALRAVEESPERFHILKHAVARGDFDPTHLKTPALPRSVAGVVESLRSLRKNPPHPRTRISDSELAELEKLLRGMGISSIGYTKLPARWVFEGAGVLHANAIVTTMEMDKVRIDTAPGPEAGEAVHEIYFEQGRAMNAGADFLRKRGLSAYAGHPLMGLASYAPLAQAAGLGQLGLNGLMITPDHGPRVRLAALFTSAENLPRPTGNPHEWILDFCNTCQVRVKKCPKDAIFEEMQQRENGRLRCIDNERGFPFFLETGGCSVCIKVCLFNHTPYERIRTSLPTHCAF